MTREKKDSWVCPECKSKQPKMDNTNTPLRNKPDEIDHSVYAYENVTLRKNNSCISPGEQSEPNTDDCTTASDLAQELYLFRMEIKGMRSDMMELRSEIQTLSASVKLCNSRTDEIEGKVEKIESRLSILETTKNEINSLQEVIAGLKAEINDKEQDGLSNDIDITCVPEETHENPIHLAKLIATKVGLQIQNQDIVWAHRVGGKKAHGSDRPRPLVVRFVLRETRDQMLRNARVRKLTTAQLGMEGQPDKAIYLNERLTAFNRQIFRKSREMGHQKEWKHIWTRNGRIFVRKNDGTQVYKIGREEDIQRVFFS